MANYHYSDDEQGDEINSPYYDGVGNVTFSLLGYPAVHQSFAICVMNNARQ
jgi:hypothetical protein